VVGEGLGDVVHDEAQVPGALDGDRRLHEVVVQAGQQMRRAALADHQADRVEGTDQHTSGQALRPIERVVSFQ
jgi:hypothetical protein